MQKISKYGISPTDSKGRLHKESSRPDVRSCFARDRDRILHSEAFRRLKGKTQVFVSTTKDHHRTRLTHSLEVSQIARTIARTLMVNEDLTETIALAHDLGHPPYGHTGEEALIECMSEYGGFEHNEQSFRIVTSIEKRYPLFDGLNLTWESLEGILKHNGPVDKVSDYIREFNNNYDLKINTYAPLEAQIASISDDVAYNHHDIEDSVRAGLVSIDDLHNIKPIGQVFDDVRKEYGRVNDKILLAEALRRLMSKMIIDIVETTKKNLSDINPSCPQDIRDWNNQTVCMSKDMVKYKKLIRKFLFDNVYLAESMNIKRDESKEKVKTLFAYYMKNPENMNIPEKTNMLLSNSLSVDKTEKARFVADYVAGMTDQYADIQYTNIKKIYKI
ncbi:MAG: deoxyguanosinetriphosphate triphosphohydrolase [Alphaproteobacteria bacterium]